MARESLVGFDHFNDVIHDIDTRFTIPKLKAMCTALGLTVSGTKPQLQGRLTTHLNLLLQRHDSARYNLAKSSAEVQRGTSYGARVKYGPSGRQKIDFSRPNGYHASSTAQASTATPVQTTSSSSTNNNNNWGMSSLYQNLRLPVYKRLPFYNLLTNVTQAYSVPACPSSRTTQPIQLRLTTEMLSKLVPKQSSNPYRLVLFCTQTDRVAFGNCVIEFPSHADIRCNGSSVQANLRGIKNRPGTINPPDVTAQIIMMQGVQNKIDVTFEQSRSAFTITVYLVQKNTVGQLVEKIRKRGFISKESTLNKMRAAAQDADIMHGPETLTLKDPISMTRVTLPSKGRHCQHTACFDTATFLTLNEQTPTWTCPICNRSISSDDDLFLDGYFYDILENTNKAVESVIIYPDGTWVNKDIDTDHPDAKLLNDNNPSRPSIKAEDRKISFGGSKPEIVSLDDDDEDIGAPTPSSLPPPQSRNTSTSVRPSPSQTPSRKRGPAQFVDLTLSDDEEDYNPPVRARPDPPPPKRIRIDPPINTHRSTSETNGVNPSLHSVLNGVSTASTVRESHIRSPPSSISPRTDSTAVFRFNHSPETLDNQPPTYRSIQAQQQEYNPYQPTAQLHNSPTITSPTQSRTQLPSPTLTRTYPTPQYPATTDRTQRSPSLSPVLPAFSPPKRPPAPNNADYLRSFQNEWADSLNPSGRWGDDDYENEDLDLEMARLPSSMFDADGTQDDDDEY